MKQYHPIRMRSRKTALHANQVLYYNDEPLLIFDDYVGCENFYNFEKILANLMMVNPTADTDKVRYRPFKDTCDVGEYKEMKLSIRNYTLECTFENVQAIHALCHIISHTYQTFRIAVDDIETDSQQRYITAVIFKSSSISWQRQILDTKLEEIQEKII